LFVHAGALELTSLCHTLYFVILCLLQHGDQLIFRNNRTRRLFRLVFVSTVYVFFSHFSAYILVHLLCWSGIIIQRLTIILFLEFVFSFYSHC